MIYYSKELEMNNKILVIGAGISGLTIARVLAENNFQVRILESRNHIAGNCYDYPDEDGFLIHKYGPHLFHTANEKIWNFVNNFSNWVPYKHKVKALLKNGMYVTLPVNRSTAEIVGKENVLNTFFRPYTKKMWGLSLEEVSPEILKRVPIRNDDNEFYFPDEPFQGLPEKGYSELCKNLIDHKNIDIQYGIKYSRCNSLENEYIKIFNSMPIDSYYEYCFGKLPYRSIKFHLQTVNIERLLPSATVNYTNDGPFTRITEWKLLPNCNSFNPNKYKTAVTVEEPCFDFENFDEKYYPINDKAGINLDRYNKYRSIKNQKIVFIGRCGMYKYINMDKAFEIALNVANDFLNQN